MTLTGRQYYLNAHFKSWRVRPIHFKADLARYAVPTRKLKYYMQFSNSLLADLSYFCLKAASISQVSRQISADTV